MTVGDSDRNRTGAEHHECRRGGRGRRGQCRNRPYAMKLWSEMFDDQ